MELRRVKAPWILGGDHYVWRMDNSDCDFAVKTVGDVVVFKRIKYGPVDVLKMAPKSRIEYGQILEQTPDKIKFDRLLKAEAELKGVLV